MHYPLRHRAVVPCVAVFVALAGAACSSDRRGLTAPSDAAISLAVGSAVVTNQQPIEVTVSVVRNDGNPVKDGTEIRLSSSAGDFEASTVRTEGGNAVVVFNPGGASGPVELVATSDEARGQLEIFALSVMPSRITVTLSQASLPPGGGDVDVTATVAGASGEPVASAKVEFFTTNGEFPAGPFLTNDEGKVTTRLNVTSEAQVRARVLAIESSPIVVAIRLPLAKGDDPSLPFRMREVTWLHEDVSEWDVTSEITDIRIDPDSICIEHTKAGRWPRRNGGEGNPWIFANIGGQWYAATYEYLRSGQICKRITRRGEWGLGPHTKKPPIESWAPRHGELVGLMVSTFARDATRTSNERSNVVMVEWPY